MVGPSAHLRHLAASSKVASRWCSPGSRYPSRPNELIVWDLRHDPSSYRRSLPASPPPPVHPPGSLALAGTRLPIKTIHLNRSPVVVSVEDPVRMPPAQVGIDKVMPTAHAQWLAEHGPALKCVLAAALQNDASRAAAPADVDEDLYGSLPARPPAPERVLRFAESPGAAMPRTSKLAFDDPRLDELVFRFRARHHASQLDEEELRWLAHCQARILEGRVRPLDRRLPRRRGRAGSQPG